MNLAEAIVTVLPEPRTRTLSHVPEMLNVPPFVSMETFEPYGNHASEQ